jgi:hypothetical protein
MRALLVMGLAALMSGPAWIRSAVGGPDSGRNDTAPDQPVALFLILRADMFLCAPCLDRVLAEVRDLAARSGHASLWWVVLYSRPEAGTDERAYRSMVARRAESVLRANGCPGPLVIDEAASWRGMPSEPAGLLVLDSRSGTAHRFNLPLPVEGSELLDRILNEGGDHDPHRDHS